MDNSNNPWTLRSAPGELALTVLRVVAGVTLLVHGWLKLTDVASWQAQVASLGMPMPEVTSWCAIAGEFLGGLGLIVGLLTPLAALGALVTMATAIALVHAGNGLLASNGGFEFPLLVASTCLVFMMRGAGPLSLDALWSRALRRRKERKSDPSPVTQAPQTGSAFHRPHFSEK